MNNRFLPPFRALARAGLAAGTLLATTVSGAADAPDTITNLGSVTVSASLNQTLAEDMPLHTTVVTREDIEKSTAQTLDQLLRTIPGFNFTGVPAAISDPTGQQTRMRGLGNAKVLVLVDGIPIIDPFYLTTQFHKVALADVDHVEVIRGGTSSLWGSMAMAGMVNIVTHRPEDDSGSVTLGAGSQGTASLAFSQDLKVSDALALNLAVNQYRTDGYLTTPAAWRWKFPQQQANTARNSNIELSAYLRFDDRLDGFLRLGKHVQDQHIGYRHGRNLQKNPDGALGLDRHFDDGGSLSWRAWAQNVHFTKYNGASCYWQGGGVCQNSNAKDQAVSDQVVQYYSQQGDLHYTERGSSLLHSQFFNAVFNSLQLGLDYRHLSARDAEAFFTVPVDPATPQTLNANGYGRGAQTFGGAFAQAKVSPLDALQLTFSARWDAWRNSDQIHILTGAAGGASGDGALPSTRKSAFHPGLGLHYDISNDWSFRGGAYKAFRVPGFNNTTRSYGVGPTTVANPDLGPETLTGWELGSDWRGDTATFGATWFRYDLGHMIATYRIRSAQDAPRPVLDLCSTSATSPNLDNCGGSANYYSNDQDGRSQGLELNARWEPTPTLELGAWFTRTRTWLTAKAPAITTPLNVQLVGMPKRTGSLDATWRPNGKLTLYAQALYIGPMYLDETTTPGTYYDQGGNLVWNASVRYAVNASLDLAANVSNLFDRKYSENAWAVTQPWSRTLASPRSIFVSARVRY